LSVKPTNPWPRCPPVPEFDLRFDEAEHRYTLDGRPVPSVTGILKPLECFETVPFEVLEVARIRGQHVHEACHLDDMGDLDEASLDQELWPYLVQWRRFRAESGFKILASEIRVAHPKLGYAGGLDKLVLSPRGQLGILELKAGLVPISVGAQTAAYDAAYREMSAAPRSNMPLRRYVVDLKPERYRLDRLDDPCDWSDFVSCLNIFNRKNRRRI
jgi:hypothetical protein